MDFPFKFPKTEYSPKILVYLFLPLFLVAIACIINWISSVITLMAILTLLLSKTMVSDLKEESEEEEPLKPQRKPPTPCPECGSTRRHKKTCSKYK